MANDEVPSDLIAHSPAPSQPQILRKPEEILVDLLAPTGVVSTMKLKVKLREAGHENANAICDQLSRQNNQWKKHDKSFYTPQRLETLLKEESEEKSEVKEALSANADLPEEDDLEERVALKAKHKRKAEERRLCENYIHPFLTELYETEHKPHETECAFVVQDQRPSSSLRNVDLVAVQWRTPEFVELITVEAKLSFSAQLVQQAANYIRFSHRVWIAVVVNAGTDVGEIAQSLYDKDPLLFEYVVSLGLGIIACQKAKGGSFNCYAVQWPKKQSPDEFEKASFIEDYRETFEEAGLLEKRKRNVRVV